MVDDEMAESIFIFVGQYLYPGVIYTLLLLILGIYLNLRAYEAINLLKKRERED
jgi:hypothetical protein